MRHDDFCARSVAAGHGRKMKGSSTARTEAGLRKAEGNFQRKMNQADLPEQERRLLAELKELCVKEDKPTKGGSVNGARPKSRKEKK